MSYDDPNLRALALRRIELLQRLVDDLTAIVTGSRPTKADLDSAVVLSAFQLSERSVPCLVGIAHRHPHLGDQLITTSQVFAADPGWRWARTMSRFYRLDGEMALHGERIQ